MNIPKREIFIAAVLLFLAFCGLNVFWLGSFSAAIVFKLPLWTGFFIFAAVLYICLASKGWFEKLHKWRQEKASHKRANPHTQIKNQSASSIPKTNLNFITLEKL